jgi:hypothetical protein
MKMTKRVGCVLSALVVMAITLTCGGIWIVFGPEQHPNFTRLLQGDNRVSISSVVFSGHGLRIELNDSDSLQYLSRAFREAEKEGYVSENHGATLGYSYYARLKLSPQGSVLIGLSIPEDANGFTVGYPMDGFDDPTYWWVRLPEPMPAAITEVLERMRRSGP